MDTTENQLQQRQMEHDLRIMAEKEEMITIRKRDYDLLQGSSALLNQIADDQDGLHFTPRIAIMIKMQTFQSTKHPCGIAKITAG